MVDDLTLTVARLYRALEHTPGTELSLPQYRILGLLSLGDERASALAHRLAVSRPTVTALADSLVERGLIAREVDADDRRAVTLSITPAGRAAVEATGAALRGQLDGIIDRCADPDAVRAAIGQLTLAVDAWWEERTASRATGR